MDDAGARPVRHVGSGHGGARRGAARHLEGAVVVEVVAVGVAAAAAGRVRRETVPGLPSVYRTTVAEVLALTGDSGAVGATLDVMLVV